MRSKAFISLILALAVVGVTSAPEKPKGDPRDVIKCNEQPGDIELTHVQIVDNGHYAGKVGIDFIYPPEDVPALNAINCIIIRNLEGDTGGEAVITKGELGDTRMTVHLSASFTKTASFAIQIFGQPKTDLTTTETQ